MEQRRWSQCGLEATLTEDLSIPWFLFGQLRCRLSFRIFLSRPRGDAVRQHLENRRPTIAEADGAGLQPYRRSRGATGRGAKRCERVALNARPQRMDHRTCPDVRRSCALQWPQCAQVSKRECTWDSLRVRAEISVVVVMRAVLAALTTVLVPRNEHHTTDLDRRDIDDARLQQRGEEEGEDQTRLHGDQARAWGSRIGPRCRRPDSAGFPAAKRQSEPR